MHELLFVGGGVLLGLAFRSFQVMRGNDRPDSLTDFGLSLMGEVEKRIVPAALLGAASLASGAEPLAAATVALGAAAVNLDLRKSK